MILSLCQRLIEPEDEWFNASGGVVTICFLHKGYYLRIVYLTRTLNCRLNNHVYPCGRKAAHEFVDLRKLTHNAAMFGLPSPRCMNDSFRWGSDRHFPSTYKKTSTPALDILFLTTTPHICGAPLVGVIFFLLPPEQCDWPSHIRARFLPKCRAVPKEFWVVKARPMQNSP